MDVGDGATLEDPDDGIRIVDTLPPVLDEAVNFGNVVDEVGSDVRVLLHLERMGLSLVVPVIDLQGDEDADHHQHDLTNGVEEVGGEAVAHD